MKTDIRNLEKLAKGAGPSDPWYKPGDLRYADDKTGEIHGLDHHADDFIAATNPAAVLELIAENERLEARNVAQMRVNVSQRNRRKEWVERAGKAEDEAIGAEEQRDQFKAEIERLQRFETAYKEFSDKTDWVRPNAAAHELGMHVADVIRKRCDDLTSHNQAQADEIVRLQASLISIQDSLDREYWSEYAGLDDTRDILNAAINPEPRP